jgi:hypothetical protein
MRFYQVNQNTTFDREFGGGYLCAPDGPYWTAMKELQRGDILFHYRSSAQSVRGISRVTYIGHHKGPYAPTARVLPITQCIQYTGAHLSEESCGEARRSDLRRKYATYLEVHTSPLRQGDFGKVIRSI